MMYTRHLTGIKMFGHVARIVECIKRSDSPRRDREQEQPTCMYIVGLLSVQLRNGVMLCEGLDRC